MGQIHVKWKMLGGKCLVEWTRACFLGKDGGDHQNPLSSGWLAQRAAPQVARKERQSFPLLSYGFHLKMLHGLGM